MKFISTRGKSGRVSSAEAIIKGLADDGGLFVPEYFPKAFEKFKGAARCTTAIAVVKSFGYGNLHAGVLIIMEGAYNFVKFFRFI